MTLSYLGIFHTLVGIIALIAAIASFLRYGKVNLEKLSGKLYLYGTTITSITALGISKLGGFNPGHVFSVFILFLVWIAFYLHTKRKGNNRSRFFENFCLSFSFFLSLIPTVNETFTRIPLGKPLAKNPGDPLIANTLLVLLILFVAGSIYQFRRQRKINRQ